MDYVPNTDAQLDDMLRAIGVKDFQELIKSLPAGLRVGALEIPMGLAEAQVRELCEKLALQNRHIDGTASFLGAGCYQHIVPAAVDALASRGEWLTPYTPYQAEASQGTLQAVYEFQTMVCELFQMDVANASLYDGASSVAEAAVLSVRMTERPRILLSEALHPHIRQVVMTYLSGAEVVIQEIPSLNGITDLEALNKALRDDVACVIMQQPNVFGCLEPMEQASEMAHRVGSLFVASAYPMSLGLLKAPGAYGADIAVGEGRCFGSPPSYGGPGLGLFATADKLLRRMPGRLAGCSIDQDGQRAFTLTLQTREQHIRREKATSNICTNEGWLALRASIFMSLLGPNGLRELAMRNLDSAHYAYKQLLTIPWIRPAFDQPFFNEWTLQYDSSIKVEAVNRWLAKNNIVGGFSLSGWYPTIPQGVLWCATERISQDEVDRLIEVLRKFS